MSEPHFEGLAWEDERPLGFAAREPLPEGVALATQNAANLETLLADASLDEQRPHDSKHDEEHALAEDLRRVESKVNVLIQLVARLLQRAEHLPPVRTWRLHADGVEWLLPAGESPPSGNGVVELHVSRHFPEPLRLPGRAIGVRRDERGTWARVLFVGLSAPVVEQLEKLIFRHHRRAIAGTRAPR